MDNFELVIADEPRPRVCGTKRCPYCGGWHSKPDPAIYCCPEHAKRSQRQGAWVLRLLKRRARHQLAERAVSDHWRDVIFGRKEPSLPGRPMPQVEPTSRRRAGKPHPPPEPL